MFIEGFEKIAISIKAYLGAIKNREIRAREAIKKIHGPLREEAEKALKEDVHTKAVKHYRDTLQAHPNAAAATGRKFISGTTRLDADFPKGLRPQSGAIFFPDRDKGHLTRGRHTGPSKFNQSTRSLEKRYVDHQNSLRQQEKTEKMLQTREKTKEKNRLQAWDEVVPQKTTTTKQTPRKYIKKV